MKAAFFWIAPPEGEARFRFIDGTRSLCLMWITTFHVIFYASFFVTAEASTRLFTAWQSRWVLRGHFALDALFVTTGFLIGYYLLVDTDRGRLSYGAFLVRRLLRLVPAYLLILLIYHFTMNFNFESVWANLIFVNNYVPLIHQTMSWSWSLPVDVHFYFLFPLVLLFVRNRPAHLLNALWIIFGVLVVVRGIVELSANVSPPLFANPHGTHEEQIVFNHYFDTIYDKTHTRIGAIVCGLMVATLVHYHSGERWMAEHRVATAVIFVLALLLGIGVLAAPVLQGEASSYDPTWSAVYLIAYNYAFALAISTIFLVILSDHPFARPLRAFLSHPLWYVPSELCYGVFLLNPLVVLGLYAYVIRTPIIAPGWMAVYGVSAIVCTFACAYVLYITVERPFRGVGKHLARRIERRGAARLKAATVQTDGASAFLHD